MAIDARLTSWAELAKGQWAGLLVGNGASRAVWDGFDYPSIYERARSAFVEHPLDDADQRIFATVGTHNFEATLAAVRLSSQVCAAVNIDNAELDNHYAAIRRALIEAVNAVHVRWSTIPKATRVAIRRALLPHRIVFSTNYDLLLYWAVMAEPEDDFVDYFWGENCVFDLADTEVWNKRTRVLFLHGALHIYRLPDGRTVKRVAGDAGSNLLAAFSEPYEGSDVPLFIAEGSSGEKLQAIHQSEYLAFCYSRLVSHRGSMVVFGHSLGESDAHIVEAMQRWTPNTVPSVAI